MPVTGHGYLGGKETKDCEGEVLNCNRKNVGRIMRGLCTHVF